LLGIDEQNRLHPNLTNNGGFVFYVNDEETKEFWFAFNDKQKNTVSNFNPATGKGSDLRKQLVKRRPIVFKKYDWDGFLSGNNFTPAIPAPSSNNLNKNVPIHSNIHHYE
jgi:hypothetical protein